MPKKLWEFTCEQGAFWDGTIISYHRGTGWTIRWPVGLGGTPITEGVAHLTKTQVVRAVENGSSSMPWIRHRFGTAQRLDKAMVDAMICEHRRTLEAAKLRDGEDVKVWVELDDGTRIDFTTNTAYIQRNLNTSHHIGVRRKLKATAIGLGDKRSPVDIDIRIDGNVRIDNRLLADLIEQEASHV